MRKLLLFIVTVFLLPTLLSAQFSANLGKYSPENIRGKEAALYIPFNDHGKWGYADTLGQIVIKPSFKNANFFWPRKMVDFAAYNANVITKAGRNFVLPLGDLLLPDKYGCVEQIIGLLPQEQNLTLFVVEKKKRYAIYHPEKGLITDFNYDDIRSMALWKDLFCLRDRKTKRYHRFIPEEQTMAPTPYQDFDQLSYTRDKKWQSDIIGITAQLDTFAFRDGTFVPFTLAGVTKVYNADDEILEFEDMSIDDGYNTTPSEELLKRSANTLQVDEVTELHNFGWNSISKKYGFSMLHVVRNGDKMGVLSEQGKAILPIIYDRVTLENGGTQARLELAGKVGRKLFFTHYPTIEPRYDELRENRSLRVTDGWVFSIFTATIDGQEGYVGENGVEYFDFD